MCFPGVSVPLTPVLVGEQVVSEESVLQLGQQLRAHRHKGGVFGGVSGENPTVFLTNYNMSAAVAVLTEPNR